MLYENKYPYAEYLEQVADGLIKGKKDGCCWHCTKQASFIDIDFGTYFCSEECRLAKWKEYWEADRLQ
jgi:hypothetical protein